MRFAWPLSALALAALLAPAGAKDKPRPRPPVPTGIPQIAQTDTQGVYQADAAKHEWTVTRAHALVWDGVPTIPAGVEFRPLAWKADAPDGAAEADSRALQSLKAAGITDLLLAAPDDGVARVPTASLQKTLDTVNALGFHYGLRLASDWPVPLSAYVIRPSVYRDPAPPLSGAERFAKLPGLTGGIYALTPLQGGQIVSSGRVTVENGDTARVDLGTTPPQTILLIYPQRTFAASAPESRLPDLWQGFDAVRDRLLAALHPLKFGPGLRFFLDPLSPRLQLTRAADGIVPASQGFQLAFEAWLGRRYAHNSARLNTDWGTEPDRPIPDFATASRCVPLWRQRRGLPALYDPAKGVTYRVISEPRIKSKFWDDLDQFRLESARQDMSAMAQVLKTAVAGVPVVYQWTGRSPLFAHTAEEKWDGLALPADLAGREYDRGQFYAQAEEASAACLTMTVGGSPSAWGDARDAGVRAFFGPPESSADARANGAPLQASAPALAAQTPRVLWYLGLPELAAEIGIRRLPGGGWWLPGGPLSGVTADFGPDSRAYGLIMPGESTPLFVLWSPQGTTQGHLYLEKGGDPTASTADGTAVKLRSKKSTWEINLTPDPLLLRGLPGLPASLDAPDMLEKQAKLLLARASIQKAPEFPRLSDQFFYAANSTVRLPDEMAVRYGLFVPLIGHLTEAVRPYAWAEGEDAAPYTFTSFEAELRASGGGYLSLDTDRDPPAADGGYMARLPVVLKTVGHYTLWAAVSPSSVGAPFTAKVDNQDAGSSQDAPAVGGVYADRFVWRRLGTVALTAGAHAVTITVAKPRADGRYVLDLDAICLSREPFTPDGPRRPEIAGPDKP